MLGRLNIRLQTSSTRARFRVWSNQNIIPWITSVRGFAKSVNPEGDSKKFVLQLDEVTKKFDTGRILFEDLSLSFFEGAKIGILGSNGAGKSSLLKIIGGKDTEFDGAVVTKKGYKIGYLDQEPELDPDKTVGEIVFEGVTESKALLDRYDQISNEFADPDADFDKLIAEQAEVQSEIDRLELWDLQRRVDIALEALRCPAAESPVTNLSGGEKRRVALCRLLLSRPDILLLDEPTNHLDTDSVSWLENFLDQYKGLVLAITHDRYFLDNVAGYIVEVDEGKVFGVKGNYQDFLENKQERLRRNEKSRKKFEKTLARELAWMKGNAKASRGKSKSRMQSVNKMIEEKQQRRMNARSQSGALIIPEGPMLKDPVIKVENCTIVIPEDSDNNMPQRTLFDSLSFQLPKYAIMGIIGPNGAGKTTLLNVLTQTPGCLEPTQGKVTIGPSVHFAYNAQNRDELNEELPLWEEICGAADVIKINDETELLARAYVAQFNFNGPEQQKIVKQLSGGERNRVQLAKSLCRGANVIILDEPTNDLDVATLRALEEALLEFEGSAIVVSHDRWFLDRIATCILAFEKDGVHFHQGNYSSYEEDRRERWALLGKTDQNNSNKRAKYNL